MLNHILPSQLFLSFIHFYKHDNKFSGPIVRIAIGSNGGRRFMTYVLCLTGHVQVFI
jgi:hypothetical protein